MVLSLKRCISESKNKIPKELQWNVQQKISVCTLQAKIMSIELLWETSLENAEGGNCELCTKIHSMWGLVLALVGKSSHSFIWVTDVRWGQWQG